MDVLAYAPVEYNFLETLARTQIFRDIGKGIHHTCQTKPIHPRRYFQQCSHSSSRDCNEHKLCLYLFFYWKPILVPFDLRQIRILRGGQPIVDFDTADNCRLYVTPMKAMDFQDDIPSIPTDDFKDHYVLVFDLTSMQEATENCHYPELVGEPLRLELNFTHPLENVTELLVLGEGMSSVAVDKFGVVENNMLKWTFLLCNKLLIASLGSNFGTSGCSIQTTFQLLIMTLLLLSTRNPANCRGNIRSWLQISDTNCFLQTLLVIKCTVFSTTSTTSRYCRHPYSLTQVYAAFIQNMQLFISSSFDRKKRLEFTMLMYFLSWVITCNLRM